MNLCDSVVRAHGSVFLIRQIGGHKAIDALCTALDSPSVLLSHEAAYVLGKLRTAGFLVTGCFMVIVAFGWRGLCLISTCGLHTYPGQMQDKYAVPMLTATLENSKLNPITRHEAAEALAAISQEDSLEVLSRFLDDPEQEVRETCELSIDRIKWNMANKDKVEPDSVYESVDPAPPSEVKSVEELTKTLCDPKIPMFQRYRAMFALRNMGDEEAVLALAEGFGDSSALFRHEIAYVMGQLQHPASVQALKKVLVDEKEHAMVRHEAAEALGSIAHEDCPPLLKRFQAPETDRIVRESCDVALDLCDYWTNDEVSSALPVEDLKVE